MNLCAAMCACALCGHDIHDHSFQIPAIGSTIVRCPDCLNGRCDS